MDGKVDEQAAAVFGGWPREVALVAAGGGELETMRMGRMGVTGEAMGGFVGEETVGDNNRRWKTWKRRRDGDRDSSGEEKDQR